MRYTSVQYAEALFDLVEEASAPKRREAIREFLSAVTKNNALRLLPEIIREFEELSDKKAKIREVTISTPERVSAEGVARQIHFKSRVTTLRDVRLLGGAVVEVDDLRVDNSVAGRLGRAREAFIK